MAMNLDCTLEVSYTQCSETIHCLIKQVMIIIETASIVMTITAIVLRY